MATVLSEYMASVGWKPVDLARETSVNKALVSLYLNAKRDMSAYNALLFEQGTRAARAAGIVTAEPLTLAQLLPSMRMPADAEPRTGTAG